VAHGLKAIVNLKSTDLIDALGKVAEGLKIVVNLPKAERRRCARRWTSFDRHHTQHGDRSAGRSSVLAADDDFLREAARLDNYNEWMHADGVVGDQTTPMKAYSLVMERKALSNYD
jgi:hypothetical protein